MKEYFFLCHSKNLLKSGVPVSYGTHLIQAVNAYNAYNKAKKLAEKDDMGIVDMRQV